MTGQNVRAPNQQSGAVPKLPQDAHQRIATAHAQRHTPGNVARAFAHTAQEQQGPQLQHGAEARQDQASTKNVFSWCTSIAACLRSKGVRYFIGRTASASVPADQASYGELGHQPVTAERVYAHFIIQEHRRQQKQKLQDDNTDETQQQSCEAQVDTATPTINATSDKESLDVVYSSAGGGVADKLVCPEAVAAMTDTGVMTLGEGGNGGNVEKEVEGKGVEERENAWLCEGAPDDLLCPVSLVLLTDPVVAPDGRTYQREELQRCIDYAAESTLPPRGPEACIFFHSTHILSLKQRIQVLMARLRWSPASNACMVTGDKEFRSPVTGLPMAPVYFPNVVMRSQVLEHIERKRAQRAN